MSNADIDNNRINIQNINSLERIFNQNNNNNNNNQNNLENNNNNNIINNSDNNFQRNNWYDLMSTNDVYELITEFFPSVLFVINIILIKYYYKLKYIKI